MSNVRDFGALGDGQHDDTEAILHALENCDGILEFPRGDYLLSETIAINLDEVGRLGLVGTAGTAKILMTGPGPAFRFVGTHDKSADPTGFAPRIWSHQRMPTVLNLEIEGRHPEADGIRLDGTMQATLEGVLLRELRHGLHVVGRCRNLLVSHCHIYHNRGVGIFLDHLNLHQAIITGSHISYCLQGGLRIEGSEIRNLQVTGNDIEYNFDLQSPASADIWIDCHEEKSTVREGTISSNTIQAKASPGGANIRIIGVSPEVNHKAGMLAITGNLIGSQETNVHLISCRGVVVSGNVLYSGHRRNVQLDSSRNIVLGNNSFDHNPDYGPLELCTGIRLNESENCVLSGNVIQNAQAGQNTVKEALNVPRDALIEVVRSDRVSIQGCQVLDGLPYGIAVQDSQHVNISGCTILETRAEKKGLAAIRFQGPGRGNLVAMNSLGQGPGQALELDPASNVLVAQNLIDPR